MSGINVAETVAAADEIEQKAKQLPQPKGYKVLCVVPALEGTFDSGIVKADTTIRTEELLTNVLFVVRLGEQAYSDPDRFPQGPWCAEGDFVLVRANTGTRVKIHGKEFRLINDDSVEAVVEDPRGIGRV